MSRCTRFLAGLLLPLALILPSPAALAQTASPAHPAQASANKSSDGSPLGAPLVLGTPEKSLTHVLVGDFEVVELKAGFGSLSIEERARFVSAKLKDLAKSDTPVSAITLRQDGAEYKVMNGDQVLMVISTADASAANKELAILATETFEKTREAIAEYRDSRSLTSILTGIGLTILSAIALTGAIILIRRGFEKIGKELYRLTPRFGDGLKIKNIQILSAQRIEGIIRNMLGGARIFAIIICLYFFLPLILSFFAVTRAIGKKVFDLFLAPLETLASSFVAYIPNFFFILVIVLVAHYALRIVQYMFKLVESGDLTLDWFYQEWAKPTYQIVRALIIIMAAISAFPYIPGSGSAAFQGVGLVLGLVVSFASSSAISNIIAGIILVYTRAFKLGDRIKINDTMGDVVEKTLLVTRIRTPKQVYVTIPNSLVLGTHILNFSSTRGGKQPNLVIHTTVTIGYDVPWGIVESLLVVAARRTAGLESEPPPFVLQTALNDFYVAYEINAFTHTPHEMPRLYSDLHRHIQDVFNEAGVEIMSPHYHAQRDGNSSTVPSILGKADYEVPRFRIESATSNKKA